MTPLRVSMLGIIWVGWVACSAEQKGAAPAAAGSRSAESHHSANALPSVQPAWVTRGSAALKGDGGRVFYGVGSASHISNASLLRTTADNRALAELSKIFNTFSASLMHDYMNSDGTQNVEQAIKTFSAVSLDGAQIVDRYVAGDGTLFSLASLDVDKVQTAIDNAKRAGLIRSDTKPVNVDELFDRHAKEETAPPPAVSQATGSTPGAQVDSASATTRTGDKPSWVDGADPRFPNATYLCAVGLAPERGAAENAGYTALAKIFSANVASTSKDFMGAYSQTGGPELDVQSTEVLTQVSTQGLLQGVRVLEVYSSGGQVYALACLERAKTAQLLRSQIDADDQQAGTYLADAAKVNQTGKVRALSRAMDAILHREAQNAQLRIVDLNGVGVRSPYSPVDVSSALQAAVEALKVGVHTEGPYDGDLRGALIAGLTSRGYKVSDAASEPGAVLDVLVSASIKVEDGGAGTGTAAQTYFARGVIQVEVKNVADNKILASFTETKKEGSRSKEEAERRAIRGLANKIVASVGGKIDATMKGK